MALGRRAQGSSPRTEDAKCCWLARHQVCCRDGIALSPARAKVAEHVHKVQWPSIVADQEHAGTSNPHAKTGQRRGAGFSP
eukprot:2639666-Alexandrium_andersonii.AAC.1